VPFRLSLCLRWLITGCGLGLEDYVDMIAGNFNFEVPMLDLVLHKP
jgi:hypothetical protein